jgi:hypothetical protein
MEFELSQLKSFIEKASSQTYAAGADDVPNPQRPDYHELVYAEGDFEYRDSYSGNNRSWGTELVRYKGRPVWNALYGGGMTDGHESLSHNTFEFLKKAFLSRDEDSFRGPRQLDENEWHYSYQQDGDVTLFNGSEKISYNGEVVFFHHIIGGLIRE